MQELEVQELKFGKPLVLSLSGIILLISLALVIFLPTQYLKVSGINDKLENFDYKNDIYEMDMDWKYIPNKFLIPSEIKTELNPLSISFPGYWAQSNIEHGGTLFTRVSLPQSSESLALFIDKFDSAIKVYINGELSLQLGQVSLSENLYKPGFGPSQVHFKLPQNTLEIVIQVSHFGADKGGFWETIKLGKETTIDRFQTFNMGIDLGILFSLLIISMLLLIFYIFRPKDKNLPFLVILSFLISIRHFFSSFQILGLYFENLSSFFMDYVPPILFVAILFLFWLYSRSIVLEQAPLQHPIRKIRTYGAPIIILLICLVPKNTIPILMLIYISYESLFFIIYMFMWLSFKKLYFFESLFQTISIGVLQFAFMLEIYTNMGLSNRHSLLTIISFIFFLISTFLYSWKLMTGYRRTVESTFKLEKLVAIKESDKEKLTNRVEATNSDLEKALDKAKLANESKTRFLANVSHEMRTPLNGIIGFTELLRDNPDSPSRDYFYKLILGESSRLLALIDQLLDLSKIEANKLQLENEVFNFIEFIDSIRATTQMRCQNVGLIFLCNLDSQLPIYIRGDPLRLRQIIDNLLSNAIKFTEKGNITLTIQVNPIHYLEITVQDTGIGIPPDKIEHIFDSFEQAHQSVTRLYGGTGLGTTIAKNLVEKMGGSIYCESDIGVGTIFRVNLPLDIPHESYIINKIEAIREMEPQWTDFPTVIIAEDYKVSAELVQKQLSNAGWIVKHAVNGQVALEMFASEAPKVFLLDIQMPILDGLSCTTELRTLNFKGPIIGLSANAFEEDRTMALNAGMDELLAKPVKRATLLKAIAQLYPPNQWIDVNNDIIESNSLSLNRGGSLMQELDGDISSLLEILREFIDDINLTLPTLKDALKHDDYATVHRIVHRIKGGALNLGALKLVEMAKNLEMSAKQGNKFGVEYFSPSFEKELRKIIHSSQRNLESFGS